jgi:hypothetical protein
MSKSFTFHDYVHGCRALEKETYYSVKRDLLECQKRPTTVSQESTAAARSWSSHSSHARSRACSSCSSPNKQHTLSLAISVGSFTSSAQRDDMMKSAMCTPLITHVAFGLVYDLSHAHVSFGRACVAIGKVKLGVGRANVTGVAASVFACEVETATAAATSCTSSSSPATASS